MSGENHNATVGVDFILKQLQVNKKTVRLQLWDIAGQDRFGAIARVYYKDAKGALLLYDITRPETFENAQKWKEEIDAKVKLPDGSPLPVLLVGNKSDLGDRRRVSNDDMDAHVEDNGFIGWYETSAKEGTNIHDAARALVENILTHNLDSGKLRQAHDPEKVRGSDIGSSGSAASDSGCPC
eukprot:g1684.t1